MSRKTKIISITIVGLWIVIAAIGAYAIHWSPSAASKASGAASFFGLPVNRVWLTCFSIVIAVIIAAALIRLFAVPRFKMVPGRFQAVIEGIVRFFRPRKRKNDLMPKKVRITATVVLAAWILVTFIISVAIPGNPKHETLAGTLKDAVLHNTNQVHFYGTTVNPSVLSGFIVVMIILAAALVIRIFAVPRFRLTPGKFQIVIELLVSFFADQAKTKSKKLNHFLGAYMFAAGNFIFWGTMSELLGIQLITTEGQSIAMPAPVSDINCAICMGVLSYLIIMASGIAGNGLKGIGYTFKEFSLPISMSFRLFGALLSGLLVTELVYYVIQLSFVLPVLVGVLFTCIHAIMQTYIICMLISMYSAEVSEDKPKKVKVKKAKKLKNKNKNIQIQAGA